MRKYILADNQELTRFALETLINKQDVENIIFKATDKAGVVELLKQHSDAVVILDYTLFDFSGEEQLLIIGERFASSQWILLSDELTPSFLRNVAYGSHQFSVLFKDSTMWEIGEALRTVNAGRRYISQKVMETIIDNEQQKDEVPDILTATEVEIVRSIALGKTTKEIAAERYSSIHTVTTHRKNIFRKLGVNAAHDVVKYAIRAGLVDTSEFYI